MYEGGRGLSSRAVWAGLDGGGEQGWVRGLHVNNQGLAGAALTEKCTGVVQGVDMPNFAAMFWFMHRQIEGGRRPRGGVLMSKHMMTVLTWILSLLSGAASLMFVLWLETIAS